MTIDEFLLIREKLLENKNHRYFSNYQFWLFVFSIQIIYGIRISEILCIKNFDSDYVPDNDHYLIKSLSDLDNNTNYIYIGDYDFLGGKNAKTGSRLAFPIIPKNYPDLFNTLQIKELIPLCLPRLKQVNNVDSFTQKARNTLSNWSQKYLNRKISQTHLNRQLTNSIAISNGISDTIRSKTLGHSIDINYKYYQNFDNETINNLYSENVITNNVLPKKDAVKLAMQLIQDIDTINDEQLRVLLFTLIDKIYP